MKGMAKIGLLVALPFVFLFLVNALSPSPTFDYLPDKCSRHCEQHGCQHFAQKYQSIDEFVNTWWYRLYRWNVKALNAVPYLDYAEANFAVYFVLYPFFIVLLLYRLLR